MASLRRQLDANGEELVDAGRGRQVALRENRRLNDDLGTMTQENQVGGRDGVAGVEGGGERRGGEGLEILEFSEVKALKVLEFPKLASDSPELVNVNVSSSY